MLSVLVGYFHMLHAIVAALPDTFDLPLCHSDGVQVCFMGMCGAFSVTGCWSRCAALCVLVSGSVLVLRASVCRDGHFHTGVFVEMHVILTVSF